MGDIYNGARIAQVTCYRLDGPGVESRCERDFCYTSIPALGPTQPPIKWVPGISQGVKRPGRGVDHPAPSSAELKERAELYLYSHPLSLRGLF